LAKNAIQRIFQPRLETTLFAEIFQIVWKISHVGSSVKISFGIVEACAHVENLHVFRLCRWNDVGQNDGPEASVQPKGSLLPHHVQASSFHFF
jgi:hypothetical protein